MCVIAAGPYDKSIHVVLEMYLGDCEYICILSRV